MRTYIIPPLLLLGLAPEAAAFSSCTLPRSSFAPSAIRPSAPQARSNLGPLVAGVNGLQMSGEKADGSDGKGLTPKWSSKAASFLAAISIGASGPGAVGASQISEAETGTDILEISAPVETASPTLKDSLQSNLKQMLAQKEVVAGAAVATAGAAGLTMMFRNGSKKSKKAGGKKYRWKSFADYAAVAENTPTFKSDLVETEAKIKQIQAMAEDTRSRMASFSDEERFEARDKAQAFKDQVEEWSVAAKATAAASGQQDSEKAALLEKQFQAMSAAMDDIVNHPSMLESVGRIGSARTEAAKLEKLELMAEEAAKKLATLSGVERAEALSKLTEFEQRVQSWKASIDFYMEGVKNPEIGSRAVSMKEKVEGLEKAISTLVSESGATADVQIVKGDLQDEAMVSKLQALTQDATKKISALSGQQRADAMAKAQAFDKQIQDWGAMVRASSTATTDPAKTAALLTKIDALSAAIKEVMQAPEAAPMTPVPVATPAAKQEQPTLLKRIGSIVNEEEAFTLKQNMEAQKTRETVEAFAASSAAKVAVPEEQPAAVAAKMQDLESSMEQTVEVSAMTAVMASDQEAKLAEIKEMSALIMENWASSSDSEKYESATKAKEFMSLLESWSASAKADTEKAEQILARVKEVNAQVKAMKEAVGNIASQTAVVAAQAPPPAKSKSPPGAPSKKKEKGGFFSQFFK